MTPREVHLLVITSGTHKRSDWWRQRNLKTNKFEMFRHGDWYSVRINGKIVATTCSLLKAMSYKPRL